MKKFAAPTTRALAMFCFVALLIVFPSCVKHKPAIVIDHSWNVDYAKNACERLKDVCIADGSALVNVFESELIASFAIEPRCTNIEVFGPDAKTGLEPYWLLMIHLLPGESAQKWSLLHTFDEHRLLIPGGEGTPKEIANSVCAIVKGGGATIR